MRNVLALFAACGLIAGCDVDVASEQGLEGGAQVVSEPPLVRVCRAATSVFYPQEPTGSRMVEAASAETVRLAYEAGVGGAGMRAECTFAGDRVTWRLLDGGVAGAGIATAAQRVPDTATYSLEGDRVRLVQSGADGATTDVTWTSTELKRSSVSFDVSTGAE